MASMRVAGTSSGAALRITVAALATRPKELSTSVISRATRFSRDSAVTLWSTSSSHSSTLLANLVASSNLSCGLELRLPPGFGVKLNIDPASAGPPSPPIERKRSARTTAANCRFRASARAVQTSRWAASTSAGNDTSPAPSPCTPSTGTAFDSKASRAGRAATKASDSCVAKSAKCPNVRTPAFAGSRKSSWRRASISSASPREKAIVARSLVQYSADS
mmetsp:Transcript_76014/g.220817  ORF Transcript_76014/g.220817 Transcript_76014/m.220817 type:complete len:220 (+) Transcript_76014:1980-2639(+)